MKRQTITVALDDFHPGLAPEAEGQLVTGYVIYSRRERLYWSNQYGWCAKDNATFFTAAERRFYADRPAMLAPDAEWRFIPPT